MRIRKNAANLMRRASEPAASISSSAHVICQLNQSPWDAIPSDYFPSSSQFVAANDSFTGNGSFDGGSLCAVDESVASMMEEDDNGGIKMEVYNGMDVEEDEELNYNKEKERVLLDYSNSVDNAASRQKIRRGSSSSCCNTTSSAARRVGKPKAAAKKGASTAAASSSNPYEFYYYSGFGPRWGKRRADRGGGDNPDGGDRVTAGDMNGGGAADSGSSRGNSSSSPTMGVFDFVDEDYDYDDDDDDDEYAGEIGGDYSKKRMRKPVKARSLKSLM